jgi:two-component system phosphate regulon response regulator PhoB/two-component system alkaline phosphatase synthesis response regulator PhoP
MSEPTPRPRVLLIDDSEIAREVASAVLESAGFEVRCAKTLGEFNVVLKAWAPHIVLADVNMPGVTGPELCQWIKRRIDTQSVPVVLYSDMPEANLGKVAVASGADAWVSKEHGIEHVSEKLSALCEEIVF